MEIVKILIILLFGFLLKNIFNLILNLKIILIIFLIILIRKYGIRKNYNYHI